MVKQVIPKLPEHIHLIGPAEKMNTYDLIDVADVGLVLYHHGWPRNGYEWITGDCCRTGPILEAVVLPRIQNHG